mgnify:CR=1 FL=1
MLTGFEYPGAAYLALAVETSSTVVMVLLLLLLATEVGYGTIRVDSPVWSTVWLRLPEAIMAVASQLLQSHDQLLRGL